ncbi:MAG TPA: sugar ABC transporter permease [Chloroflexota bacterium]|nr:sugar ABC transporter permease [Chloroflexota bacterium]
MERSTLSSAPKPPGRPLLAILVGGQSNQGARKALWGYLFIAPWLIGLLVFVAGPILASLYLSLTTYDILSAPRWVGLDNYRRAFFEDPLFWPSLGRTFYYAFVVVPLGLAGSLLLAQLLNQGLRATNLFRTAFFLPSLTPGVALSVLWLWLLNPKLGLANQILRPFGLGDFPWLTDSNTVIPSLILITLLTTTGGGSMLIFLAGLQGVPKELEEAATVDGAGRWMKFRHVTLPMITPTLFFNLVLGIIGALQAFTVAFVATNGGPDYGSWFIALHIYQQAFAYLRLGYGATLAWIFLVIVLLLTLVNFAFSRRWVFYRGGS